MCGMYHRRAIALFITCVHTCVCTPLNGFGYDARRRSHHELFGLHRQRGGIYETAIPNAEFRIDGCIPAPNDGDNG